MSGSMIVEDLKRQFDGSVCAVCMETIQGEGGISPVSREFLQTARELTEKSGALLLLDEIQSGLGRTGKYFAYQHYGITPDIVTVAKPLAAGLPLGAIADHRPRGERNSPRTARDNFRRRTAGFCGGHRISAPARSPTSSRHEIRKLFHRAAEGAASEVLLRERRARYGSDAGDRADSSETAKAVVSELLAKGILINRTHETVLRFLPPYIIEKKHVDEVVHALDFALAKSGTKSTTTQAQRYTRKTQAV